MFQQAQAPVIREINPPQQNPQAVRLFIKREDLLHPVISGNKWRKLRYNLEAAREAGETTLLTFGGAYSNHIHAVAGAAHEYGFKSIGIIRGEEHFPLNPTLAAATRMGMEIHYLDRSTYREKHTAAVFARLQQRFGHFYLIPEGGTNELAIKGAAEMVAGIEDKYDYFCLACGTGGTATGVIAGLAGKGQVLGFSVLKGDFHARDIRGWLAKLEHAGLTNWRVNTNYHFGGYAKFDWQLIKFINDFKKAEQIPLDPIYTGKMLFGVYELIKQGFFPKQAKVLAIHTGGLQGIAGFNQRFNNLVVT